MNVKTNAALCLCTFLLIANILSAQTYNDGPMELRIRVVEVKVDYHPDDNVSNDFNLSGSIGNVIGQFINVPSLETDEITAKIWVRDNVGSAWQGGTCEQGNLPMVSGGPETFTVNRPDLVFNYPGQQVPQFVELKLEAWEDEKPADFDALPSGVPFVLSNDCQSNDGWSRCNYDGTQTPCITLFGAPVLDMEDDIYCNADPFQTGIDYRSFGPPCKWNDHGWSTGTCPQNNYYQVRIQSYYRFTLGVSCASPFDLGVLNSGGVLSHLNNNECYSNTLPGSQPGNDVFYKFRINAPMGVDINLCNAGTLFDTYVFLLDGNCSIIDFNDDGNSAGCGTKSLISRPLCNAGDYYVVVDAKTAATTGQFQLFITENPTFTFAANITKTDPKCNGGSDGSAEVTAQPPNPNYTYMWNDGNTNTIRSGLSAGTYSVTVTNPANGCTVASSVTLINPALFTVSVTTTNLTCSGQNDGTATATASGGTTPYLNYVWSNSLFGPSINNLSEGTYSVTVSDFNFCTATASGDVTALDPIVISATTYSDISCYGANDGAIATSVTGGNPPYTWLWMPGNFTTSSVSSLPPGPITVTVYDATGNGQQCFDTMSFSIYEPPPLVSTIIGTLNVTCNGGRDGVVDLEVTGGTPISAGPLSYSYLWSDNSTRGDLYGSPAGNVSVIVTDANGCTATSDTVLTEPPPLASTLNVISHAGCYGSNGGSVDLEVTGGTGGYTYRWLPNEETSQDISGLAAGNFSVVITDASGCVKVDNVTINQLPELNVQPVVTNPPCIGKDDGRISLTVTGAPPFTYNWSSGSTAEALSDLVPGPYTVTITDANQCTAVITADVATPTANCGGNIMDVAVPNVFSPNGDIINDRFDIYRAEDVSKVSMKIYDRWGAKIYENPDQQSGENQGWDGTYRGKDAQTGVYVYVMEIEYSTPVNDRPTLKTGTITIIR